MAARRAPRARYEITVQGVLGPVVLSALPGVTAARRPARTVLLIRQRAGYGIAEVARRLVGAGAEIIAIRLLRDREEDGTASGRAGLIPLG